MPRLTLREKIGQLFMIGFPGTQLPAHIESFIHTNNIGFVILFSRNIESFSQVQQLTQTLHSLGKIHPLIYTDQEGGPIVRFGEMAATVVSAMGLTATGNPENAETAGRLIGQDMRLCGIDGVFAPVLDVNVEAHNPVIGIRSFSDLPDTVFQYAEKFVKGLNSAGVLACGKHFPGHGGAAADSHLEIPKIPFSFEYFLEYCCLTFQALAYQNIDSLMTAHVRFPEIDREIATFSPFLVQYLLRKQFGYKGVVFTDCLEMKAVKDRFSSREIVKKAMKAGIDVFSPSHTLDFQKELLENLVSLVEKGTIPGSRIDESVERIMKLKKSAAKLGKIVPQPSGRWRSGLETEKAIANSSVTLLRNHRLVLPLKKSSKTLVIEWAKRIGGPSVVDQVGSFVEEASHRFIKNSRYIAINPGEPLNVDLKEMVQGFDSVLVFIYSRTGDADRRQSEGVRLLHKIRKDTAVISLENPYEIMKFPKIDTYMTTYGYRKIQVEAAFNVITGAIKPTGRLPVEVRNIFPRNFCIE